MSFSSSTRWALQALPSTIARQTQPHLRLPSASSSLLSFGRRSISQSPIGLFDVNDDGFPKTLLSSTEPPTPQPEQVFSFAPNFFAPLAPAPVLQAALQAAEDVPLSFLSEPEQAQHRLLLRHLNRGLNLPSLEDRTKYFHALDLSYTPRADIELRQREKARRSVEKGVGAEDDKLTMEEWDERSRKRIEEKMEGYRVQGEAEEKTEEEKEKGEKTRERVRRKIEASQAAMRKATVLRREVREETK